ncbi:MAG: hypothetical protein KME09_04260 [Pleurocapsa minor HA4230-MV1]|jgi:hypothetical protein|nr:hypothetical protein [Pleurocapsa minor HA4230-MV1]
MILVILKFSYLAALAVMPDCPVCKYSHREEVRNCQRCNWSMKDDLDSIGINPEHPILATYIPTIVNRLEEEAKSKNNLLLHIQTLDPDNQKANNQKLDELIDIIEYSKKEYFQEIETLKEQVIELKCFLESKNNYSNVDPKTTNNSISTKDIQTLLPIENTPDDLNNKNVSNIKDNENHSIFSIESDRNVNNDPNSINEPQEGSLYNETGDRESSKSVDTQEDTAPELNSNRNYQSFYRLIKNGELEAIKVAVPQETVEKIRGGTNSELKFVNDRKGNYWIVNWHEVYCLIPKEKININQYQYGNFQRIFNCQNYQETYKDLEVIEPATVLKSDGETWQLERKGKIKFI